jgi:hypothetical protein
VTVATEVATPYDARMTGDDLTLVQAMATGDAGSLSAFYDRHASTVFATCLQLSDDPQAAEELLVDGFHAFWHDAAGYNTSRGTPLAALLAELRRRAGAPAGEEAGFVEPVPPRHELKSELMTRIAREQDAVLRHKPIPDPHDPYRGVRRVGQAFAALAAVVFIVVLVNVWTTRRINAVREEVRGEYKQQLMQKDAMLMLLQSVMARDADVKQVLERAKFKVIELTSNDGKAVGRILIDDDTHTCYLFAAGLSPRQTGKGYELWFVTADQKKTAAGTFNTDENGAGRLKGIPPAELGNLSSAIITDEQGSVHLAGKPK